MPSPAFVTLPKLIILVCISKRCVRESCVLVDVHQQCMFAGADPGGVLWVLKHPPSGLRYMYNIIDTGSQLLTVVVYTTNVYY